MLDRSNLILSASLNSKLPAVFNFLQLSLTWLNQFILFCNLQLKFKFFEPFLRSKMTNLLCQVFSEEKKWVIKENVNISFLSIVI